MPKVIPKERKNQYQPIREHTRTRIIPVWPERWRWISFGLILVILVGLAWFFRFRFYEQNGWNYRFDRWTQKTFILVGGDGWEPVRNEKD